MKLLVVIPRYNLTNEVNYDYTFPLGIAYVFSSLRKNGFDVDVINLNHVAGKIEDIINQRLSREKYDFVLTGGNALIYAVLEGIIKTANAHRTKPITVLGGPIVTSEPELMIKSLRPSFGVLGEGEETIVDLVKSASDKRDLSKVRGIIYLDKGEVIKTEPRLPIENIEPIPYPDFERFGFEEQIAHIPCNRNYHNNCQDFPRPYPILGSRGCPFNCTFCWHSQKFRSRSVKDIIKEIKLNIERFKINNIVLYDDCFSTTKERVYEFCKEIQKIQKKTPWEITWTCQLLVNSMDKDMLRIMKEAGCRSISYGFESYDPIVLKSMRKPITPEQIKRAFDETLEVGIGIQANFILGDIAETRKTAKVTIDFWKNHCKGQIGLGLIQPYPGSKLYEHCIKKGIIKDKRDYIKNNMGPNNAVNMTDAMTDKEFNLLRKAMLDLYGKYARFIEPLHMKMRNRAESAYDVAVKCPFCSKTILYKNCFVPNKYTFGFNLICRNCGYRFYVVSYLQKLAYSHYVYTRALRNIYLSIKKLIMEKSL